MSAAAYFCGAGGSSRGLHDAGYKVVAYDVWPVAVATHNANGMVAHVHDLSDPLLDDRLPHAPLAWFSTPCQPFSAAGDGDGEFDERDGFPWALRILAKTLPAVAIFENVKGLTFDKHRRYFEGILHAIHRLGYRFEWRVLNTAAFGVPQTRERCIIIARRDGGDIRWPEATHTEQEGMFTAKWVSMADALGWSDDRSLTQPRGQGMSERHGSRPATPGSRPAPTIRCRDEYFVRLHSRQNNRDGSEIVFDVTDRPAPTVGTKVEGQWWLERPATTIAGDVRVSAPGRHDPTVSGSQQADAIRLTIPELARLQDFPDDWIWTGTKTDQARQIGNAVPATLARILAEANRPITAEVAA